MTAFRPRPRLARQFGRRLVEWSPELLADPEPLPVPPEPPAPPAQLAADSPAALPAPPEPPAPVPAATDPQSATEAVVVDEPAVEPAPTEEVVAKRGWFAKLGVALLGIVVVSLTVALGAWAMWTMLNNLALYLQDHYPEQFPTAFLDGGALAPIWQGSAARAVLVIDAGMVLWTLLDFLARLLRKDIPWLRTGARAMAAASIFLNAYTGTDIVTVVVHAAPAGLYVGSVEALAALIERTRRRRTPRPARISRRGRLPFLRWLFGPRRWWTLRRVFVDGISYEEAVEQRHNRLRAEAAFTEAFGEHWRQLVPATVMVEYKLGLLTDPDPVALVAEARRTRAALTRELVGLDAARQAAEAAGVTAKHTPGEASSTPAGTGRGAAKHTPSTGPSTPASAGPSTPPSTGPSTSTGGAEHTPSTGAHRPTLAVLRGEAHPTSRANTPASTAPSTGTAAGGHSTEHSYEHILVEHDGSALGTNRVGDLQVDKYLAAAAYEAEQGSLREVAAAYDISTGAVRNALNKRKELRAADLSGLFNEVPL